ncbi:YrhK family protein [Marivibrio halodurans]|uniref:YrhK family protein n=1 Tax=Marivibrio halodurans TaxID=2039722 RepID=A0A8J7RX43_9PROT|nr:YrhK family protein [Marivibrio halodurans]MBP5856352.1 YrhK family protein [Marivibrio halodurans]
MRKALKILVKDFGWIHLSLGLGGNLAFFVGSVFFLPSLEAFKLAGIWLFIIGSFFMLIGALGELLVRLWREEDEGE